MRERPCPAKYPLTDTPCALLDDRLDHGSVGHIAVVRAGETASWMPTATDERRWAAAEAGPRIPQPRRPPDDDPTALLEHAVAAHA